MFVNRTRGVVAATLGALALGACTDPAQDTDLRPEGPPEVLAVLVMTDAAAQLTETATYCKTGDAKRPAVVGLPDFTTAEVCPADISMPATMVDNAYPDGWYIRIMFDELLDPEIETLTEIVDSNGEGTGTFEGSIAASRPVELKCESVNGGMVNVDYDGYYQPAGNRVTWPLGPSLVIKPNNPKLIATDTPCEMTILTDKILDKQGEAVPASDRGPYPFRVAPIKILATTPEDDADGAVPVTGTSIWYDNVYVQFNTTIDQSSLCDEGAGMNECEFDFAPQLGWCYQGTTNTVRRDNTALIPCHVGGDPCPTSGDTCKPKANYFYDAVSSGLTDAELFFGPTPPVKDETAYTFEWRQGTKIADRCGRSRTFGAPSADDGTQIHFTVDKFDLDRPNIATGETASPMKKLKVSFTNIPKGGDNPGGTPFPAVTIDPTAWSITPAPFDDDGTTALTNGQMQVVPADFSGQFFVSGNYKPDTMYTFTLKKDAVITDAWGAKYTQPEDLTVSWKTQPKVTMGSTIPADKGTVDLDTTANSPEYLLISFNSAMDPTSLAASEYSVTGSAGAVAMDGVDVYGCDTLSTYCYLLIYKIDMAAGDYKLTINAGATIDDIFGGTYTQAADKVINFTVKAPASTPVQCL